MTRQSGQPRASRGDAGETLIEILVTLMVIGVGVTAILGGFLVAVSSSTLSRSQAHVQAALRSWAESLTATTDGIGNPYHYVDCAGTGDFPAPTSMPAGYTAQVTSVAYWNGSDWSSACPLGADQGVQRVRITIAAPGSVYSAVTQYLDVVVRRPCASSAAC